MNLFRSVIDRSCATPCTAAWCGIILWTAILPPTVAHARETALSILTDFERQSVAASISEVDNVLLGDCDVRRNSIPARGTGSLAVEIGATRPGASVACDLVFREATRFDNADRVITHCWINEGQFEIAFRIRDAQQQVFETPPQPVDRPLRWLRIEAGLDPSDLRRVRGTGPIVWPIEIHGYRISTQRVGKQLMFLDDLQVQHSVDHAELIDGEILLNEPTHIYGPGAKVEAVLVLENRSRQQHLALSVDLAWMNAEGATLTQQRARVTLPPSGDDYRSHRELDFSQTIGDPGLYRLVARTQASGWLRANTFETTIAVTPSNRKVSRGRATFFGVRSNLLREPELDQLLEISVARDIGANLLALDVPWREIQPKRDTFEFDVLAERVADITQRDMAVTVVLTDPPEWLPRADAGRRRSLVAVIRKLADEFGGRLAGVEVSATALPDMRPLPAIELVRAVARDIAAETDALPVLPPAIAVDDRSSAPAIGKLAQEDPSFPLVFATEGSFAECVVQLEAYRKRGGFSWQSNHIWLHTAAPLIGAGRYDDAEAVLCYYVRAAKAGVGGLIWTDLRDDDNDRRHPDLLRGLVRRDFSPKTRMLGYASAAGQLTGFRCTGEVAGTPDAYTSAMFVGADRQVAVLLPRANRRLPAVLQIGQQAPGEVSVQDFERRPRPVLESVAPPLIATIHRPLFVTLRPNESQADPKLAVSSAWLQVPRTVFCGDSTPFTIRIDAPITFRRSFIQVRTPKQAPYESSLSAVALRGERGTPVEHTVELRPVDDAPFESAPLTLRLSLEGDVIEVPLDVRPLLRAVPEHRKDDAGAAVAQLLPPPKKKATASGDVRCHYTTQTVTLQVAIEDERVVPTRRDEGATPGGDQLVVGLVRVGQPEGRVWSVDLLDDDRVAVTPGKVDCTVDYLSAEKRRYTLTVPVVLLGGGILTPDDLLRLSVRYVDDDADGFPPVPIEAGHGLSEGAATDKYRWVELVE